MFDIKK